MQTNSPSSLPANQLAPQTLAELADARVSTDWLWHGFLARGSVTVLTSQWKTGKTTLLSVLMSKLHSGGELAGRNVKAAAPAIVSEETPVLWRLRADRLEFGPRALFFCRPFKNKPTPDEWSVLIDRLAALHAQSRLDVAVLDPLVSFLPVGTENSGDALFTALRALERLTQTGVAVLILHHPRKGAWRPGQAARGSGVLSSYADILIEMSNVSSGNADGRRRRLSSWSRYEETPRDLVIELSADGKDYTVCDDEAIARDQELEHGLAVTHEILVRVGSQMTRERIVDEWPEKRPPNPGTVWRWLELGVERGLFARYGKGKKKDPFRYALAGVKTEWQMTEKEFLESLTALF
jgi:hypothetical protein